MNHIMPKAVALALACALTLPLAACGGDKTNQPSPCLLYTSDAADE